MFYGKSSQVRIVDEVAGSSERAEQLPEDRLVPVAWLHDGSAGLVEPSVEHLEGPIH